MAEFLTEIEIGVRVDTNKRSLLYERVVQDEEELEEAMEKIRDEIARDLS